MPQYIVPIRFGSRIFAPRLFTTLLRSCADRLALRSAAGSCGVPMRSARCMQVRRGRRRHADHRRHAAAAPLSTHRGHGHIRSDASSPDRQHEQRRRARGLFRDHAVCIAGGGWVLVNRGWVPVGASRAEQPPIEVSAGARELHGRTDNLPRAGIGLGEPAALWRLPIPWSRIFRRARKSRSFCARRSGARAAEVVLLDRRRARRLPAPWQAPGFPPMRHVAYAVQWFGSRAHLGA